MFQKWKLDMSFFAELQKNLSALQKKGSSYHFHFMIQYCFLIRTKERKIVPWGFIYRGFNFTNMEKKGNL